MQKIHQCAQGDILLILVERPESKIEIGNGRIVVGYGEASGHEHVVIGADVKWLVDACEDINTLEQFALGQRVDSPALFVDVPDGGAIVHEKNGQPTVDHSQIDLPPGTYQVVRQRMATAVTVRPVYD